MTISKNFNTLRAGLWIYTAGVALQEFFILCFLCLVYLFPSQTGGGVYTYKDKRGERPAVVALCGAGVGFVKFGFVSFLLLYFNPGIVMCGDTVGEFVKVKLQMLI